MFKEVKPEERNGFEEVVFAPGKDRIFQHLKSCKKCKKECSCPLGVDVPAVVKLVKDAKLEEAKLKVLDANPFLNVCSRLCPAPCQASCSKKIKVSSLLRFLADVEAAVKVEKVDLKKRKIAVIGGGITGLTSAYHLAKRGYSITIFEALPELGGFLNFKIPEFRLPKEALGKDIANITALPNIEVKQETIIGHAFGIPQIIKSFDAILVCTGANKPALMHIPGEALLNIYTANEFLSGEGNTEGGQTFVIGGGNSAIDAARLARRLKSDVTVMYRRSLKEMPADERLVRHAAEEGIKFLFLTRPVRFIGSSTVQTIECEQLMLGEKDFDERKRPIPIEESNFELLCDRVIIAVGAEPNPSIGKTRTIRAVGKERVWVDQDYMTSMPGVFAAGDIVSNGQSILSTFKSALGVVDKIDAYLQDGG